MRNRDLHDLENVKTSTARFQVKSLNRLWIYPNGMLQHLHILI